MRRSAAIVLGGSIAAFTVLVVVPADDTVSLLRDLVFYNLAHLAAAVLCAWPHRGSRASTRAWRLLAVAILLSTAGNVCYTLFPDAPGLLAPTLSDDLYLAFYPLANVVLMMLARDHRPRPLPAVWLDGLMVGLASAAVAAALVLAPLLQLEQPVSSRAVTNLAYPVADLTLLIVLATVAGATRLRMDRRLAVLGAGLALNLVADVGYLLLDLAGNYHEGDPVDLGWLIALVPIAAAASLPHSARDPGPPRELIERPAILTLTLSGLAALAVLTVGTRTTLPLAATELAVACLVVALLRTALTLHQMRELPAARREARTDPLTALPNRRHLQEHCTHLLGQSDAAPVTLLMVDLNGFKNVNDRYGHLVGDALLVEVAARLGTAMRRDDLLARLGGDEFAAVLPRTTPREAQIVARRMQAALAQPVIAAGHYLHVGASIGTSYAVHPGSTSQALFHDADAAMYRAKNGHQVHRRDVRPAHAGDRR